MMPPSSGKLVSSVAWKLRFDQLKPELMPVDVTKLGRKMKGVVSRERSKEEQGEKEASSKQTPTEPTRIKIFEGGYKSNEDYVYVRGRGRGKYICEECGIRCKKPSMLKKHIRTHTDVRPYVCKFCNFAFKTKGNLTKHMKSKAHMKKCLELGVSVSSVEDIEADEADGGEEGQRVSGRAVGGVMAEHQFSDADDSEGGEEDGDEVDEDDDEDDDYDGDSTPKTRSRSTSPQPYGLPSLSITAVAASHPAPIGQQPNPSHHPASDLLGNTNKQLFGYFTTVPSIQITPQAPPSEAERERCQAEYQRSLQGVLGSRLLVPPSSSSSMDEDLPEPSPDLSSPSSRLSSPGLDPSCSPSPLSPSSSSSPSSRRYLSPRRDLSPRAGRLSPRREVSPLRPVSPRRDYRRDLSPRRDLSSRGHLSPLSRPTSPAGRDYKRDLSPRGRHRGIIRPLSPRRGLHHHQQSHQASQQGGAWSLRQGHQAGQLTQGEVGLHRTSPGADMETEQRPGSDQSPRERDQGSSHGNPSSPPHQVLFSHLPLHSQLQVRSPFPMIPIGGIQMVHSVPTSVTSGHAHTTSGHAHNTSEYTHNTSGHAHNTSGHAPLHQQGVQQASSGPVLQMCTSEESSSGDASNHLPSSAERGGAEWPRGATPPQGSLQDRMMSGRGGGDPERRQQDENIQTCTKAIASLCIDSEESVDRWRGGAGGGGETGKDGGRDPSSSSCSSSPSAISNIRQSPPSPHPSPSPPQALRPGSQHFTGLELGYPSPRPSSSSSSSSSPHPHPPSPGTEALHPTRPSPASTPHVSGPKAGTGTGWSASYPRDPEERGREARQASESTKRSKDVC